MTDQIEVLDHGYVRLVDVLGDDLTPVNAARVSFNKESKWDHPLMNAPQRLNPKDKKLLHYLADHGHTSPFRHAVLSFEVYAPLMVMRQWSKYAVGSQFSYEFDTLETWNESCFPGHQTLRHWSGKKSSVEHLFHLSESNPTKLPFVRSVDTSGEIIRNKIKRVWGTGVSQVYRVTSDLGFTVETTSNHRFLTPDGYKTLSELSAGDLVMMNGVPAYRDAQWLREKYVIEGLEQKEVAALAGCSHHTIRKWVREFGLQQDQVARLQRHNQIHGVFGKGETSETNPIIAERSRKMRLAKKGQPVYATWDKHHAWQGDDIGEHAGRWRARQQYTATKCDYCDETSRIEIHHRDRNPLNNSPENIGFLCSKHHRMVHGLSVKMVAHPVPIKSIELVGEFDVYDIEMEGTPNLVVNQFVVHNSRRYVTEEPKFYIPTEWRSAPENKKQGSGPRVEPDLEKRLTQVAKSLVELELQHYRDAIEHGVCPEQARVLITSTYAMYIRARWTVSLQGVIHFLQQRLHEDAQVEIRLFAEAVRDLVKPRFPESLEAFGL